MLASRHVFPISRETQRRTCNVRSDPISPLRFTKIVQPPSIRIASSVRHASTQQTSTQKSFLSIDFVEQTKKDKTPTQVVDSLQSLGYSPDDIWQAIFSSCGRDKDITGLNEFRDIFLQSQGNPSLLNRLVTSYAKCEDLDQAHDVYDMIPLKNRDPTIFNSLANAYGDRVTGKVEDRLHDIIMMDSTPDVHVIRDLIYACRSRSDHVNLKKVHALIRPQSQSELAAPLIAAYTACNDMDTAYNVFRYTNTQHDVVSLAMLLEGCAKIPGQLQSAFNCFTQIESILPGNETAWRSIIQACAINSDHVALNQLWQMYQQHVRRREIHHAFIQAYAGCGDISLAKLLFDQMGSSQNLASYAAMLNAYASRPGYTNDAMSLFAKAITSPGGINDIRILSAIFTLWNINAPISDPDQIQDLSDCLNILSTSQILDPHLAAIVIQVCAKTNRLADGQKYLDRILASDIHCDRKTWMAVWNAHSISGGYLPWASPMIERMVGDLISIDAELWRSVLNACASNGDRYAVHKCAEHLGFLSRDLSQDLVEALAQCGDYESALSRWNTERMHTTHSWNTMMAIMGNFKRIDDAIQVFERFQTRSRPDALSIAIMMHAYAQSRRVDAVIDIFDHMEERYQVKPNDQHRIILESAKSQKPPVPNQIPNPNGKSWTYDSDRKYEFGSGPTSETIPSSNDDLALHPEIQAMSQGFNTGSKSDPVIIFKNSPIDPQCLQRASEMANQHQREIRIRDSNEWHVFLANSM